MGIYFRYYRRRCTRYNTNDGQFCSNHEEFLLLLSFFFDCENYLITDRRELRRRLAFQTIDRLYVVCLFVYFGANHEDLEFVCAELGWNKGVSWPLGLA